MSAMSLQSLLDTSHSVDVVYKSLVQLAKTPDNKHEVVSSYPTGGVTSNTHSNNAVRFDLIVLLCEHAEI